MECLIYIYRKVTNNLRGIQTRHILHHHSSHSVYTLINNLAFLTLCYTVNNIALFLTLTIYCCNYILILHAACYEYIRIPRISTV